MAYCTSDEVQSDFKALTFTASTLVTSSDVTQFIVEADALINSYIGMKYTAPVTSGDCLSLLKLFSRTLVAERIRGIVAVKQASNASANQDARGGMTTKDVMAALRDIQKGNVNLAGASLLISGAGFYSSNDVGEVEPTFTMEDKAW